MTNQDGLTMPGDAPVVRRAPERDQQRALWMVSAGIHMVFLLAATLVAIEQITTWTPGSGCVRACEADGRS